MQMSNMPPEIELGLLSAELAALVENTPVGTSIVVHATGDHLNQIVECLENLLGQDLSRLKLTASDMAFVREGYQDRNGQYFGERFRSKAQAAYTYSIARRNQRSVVVDERYEILATLVDAYMKDRSRFTVKHFAGSTNPVIAHPGLHEQLSVPWSHIDALVSEGLLVKNSTGNLSTKYLTIPTQVYQDFQTGSGLALSLPSGRERIQALKDSPTTNYYMTTHVHGGLANIANASRDFHQTANASAIQPGDKEAFTNALDALGLSNDDVAELSDALEADQAEAGEITLGSKAKAWIGDFALRATETSSVAVITALAKQYAGVE